MSTSLIGYDEKFATFSIKAEQSLHKGELVKVTADNEVGATADGDLFIGTVKQIQNGICTVQTHGLISSSYSDTEPVFGGAMLVSNGTGGVKTYSGSASAPFVQVVEIDTASKVVSFLL